MNMLSKFFGKKTRETAQNETVKSSPKQGKGKKSKKQRKMEHLKADAKQQGVKRNEAKMEKASIYHLIVLDESGSMSGVTHQTISGCNETIQSVRAMQKANPDTQSHFVSIYLFDSEHSRYIIRDKAIDEVREITADDYRPNACTPLFDALGRTLTDLQVLMKQPETLGYATIITDGLENASREYTLAGVRELIKTLKAQNVIFTFIGANIDAESYAKGLDINNFMQFTQDDEGMHQMWEKERRSKMRSMAKMSYEREYDVEFCMKRFACESNSEGYYDEDVDISRIADDKITELKDNEIFVFGSNREGNHNGGAAALAVANFGAKQGQAEGLQGQSYAIPTDGVDKGQLNDAIQRFCTFAAEHPELTFLVTAVGCGAAGWSAYDVAPMFQAATQLKNVKLPKEFCDYLSFLI